MYSNGLYSIIALNHSSDGINIVYIVNYQNGFILG